MAIELELNMLAVLQYDLQFDFPFPYVKQYFNLLNKKNSALPSDQQANPNLLKQLCHEALNFTRDTYFLHDYFLFFSPILLAATAVHLALRPGGLCDRLGDSVTQTDRAFVQEARVSFLTVFS